jgi:hypothetical protein
VVHFPSPLRQKLLSNVAHVFASSKHAASGARPNECFSLVALLLVLTAAGAALLKSLDYRLPSLLIHWLFVLSSLCLCAPPIALALAQAQRHSALFDSASSERTAAASIVADAASDAAQWRHDLSAARASAEVHAKAALAASREAERAGAVRRASEEAGAQAAAAAAAAGVEARGYASPRETGLASRSDAVAAKERVAASALAEAATKAAALRRWLGAKQAASESMGEGMAEGMAGLLAAAATRPDNARALGVPLGTGIGTGIGTGTSPKASAAGTTPVAAPLHSSRRAQLYEVKEMARRHMYHPNPLVAGGEALTPCGSLPILKVATALYEASLVADEAAELPSGDDQTSGQEVSRKGIG